MRAHRARPREAIPDGRRSCAGIERHGARPADPRMAPTRRSSPPARSPRRAACRDVGHIETIRSIQISLPSRHSTPKRRRLRFGRKASSTSCRETSTAPARLRAVPATVAVRRWRAAPTRSRRARSASEPARGSCCSADCSTPATRCARPRSCSTHAPAIRSPRSNSATCRARSTGCTDSLTVAVLRELGRSRHIDMARATSSPTTSLAALKAYLQGEQFYRAAPWDSAQTWFERALSFDTAFALAYHRLAAVRAWRDPKDIPDSMTFELMRRASCSRAASARASGCLATVDSLSAEAEFAWRRALRGQPRTTSTRRRSSRGCSRRSSEGLQPVSRTIPSLGSSSPRRVGATTRRLARRARRSRAPRTVRSRDRARFRRSRRRTSRRSRSPRISTGRRARADTSERISRSRRPDAFADSSSRRRCCSIQRARGSIDVARLADTLSGEGLCEAATLLRHVADSSEVVVRLARARRSPIAVRTRRARPMCALPPLVNGLQFRGHLRDAYRLASRHAHWLRSPVMLHLAGFGIVPADTARVAFQQVLSLCAENHAGPAVSVVGGRRRHDAIRPT